MKTLVSIAGGVLLACCGFLFGSVSASRAQSPSASPVATPAPLATKIVTHPPQVVPKIITKPVPVAASFFPSADQSTGVWQGCGPAQNQGLLDDFNSTHPRVRIVQVFIDASIACRSPGAHTYVIVYQGAAKAR